MVKHTNEYYIKKIKKIFEKAGLGIYRQTYNERCTPRERGVRINFEGVGVFEGTTRESLYNKINDLYSDQL